MSQRDGLLAVGDQALFAYRALARAVARIFGEDRSQPQLGERSGVELAVAGMPGVAVKYDDSSAHRAGWLRHQATEVLRRRPGAKHSGNDVLQGDRVGVVEQAVLEHGDPCKYDQASDGDTQHQREEFHRLESTLLRRLCPGPATTPELLCRVSRLAPLCAALQPGLETGERLVGGRRCRFAAHGAPCRIQMARVFVVMAIQAKQLPVAAVRRIVVVVVVAVMHGQLTQIFMREFACAAATDPGIDLQGALPIALFALLPAASRLGDDTVQPVMIRFAHLCPARSVAFALIVARRAGRFKPANPGCRILPLAARFLCRYAETSARLPGAAQAVQGYGKQRQ